MLETCEGAKEAGRLVYLAFSFYVRGGEKKMCVGDCNEPYLVERVFVLFEHGLVFLGEELELRGCKVGLYRGIISPSAGLAVVPSLFG